MRGGEVAISAFLTRLPDPGHAVRLQDCNVSTFGRALHRLDQVQAAWRAPARHWWQFAAVAKSRGFAAGGTRVSCDFSIFSGTGVRSSKYVRLDGRSNYFRLGPGCFVASRSGNSLCAPRCGPRARARAATGGFFSEEVQSRAYAPPHASSVYRGPSLPLPATHTLTRVGGPTGTGARRWPREPRHRRGARVGCRPSWARRCTTRRSSTTVRAARSPVRIRSHCRGTAHEPRPASAAAAGAASGSTPTSLPGTRSTHPLSLFSTVLSSGPAASALALATGLGRCLPGVQAYLVRRVSLVTEEGAIACAKVQAAPMYEVKLRPAISLAASRHFMHSTRLASRPRQSHLPRSGYGRAMR